MEITRDCIVLEKINKFYGEKQVLSDVDISVPPGIIYGLLGPSGCGKTTTVKIMAGILAATSGEAYVLGEEMPKLALMNQIGYMAQSDALYLSMTAMENLNFFGALYGMKGKEIKQRSEAVLELVNLTVDKNKQVSAYSGGMKRRLSLAMALLHNPKILILDEPTVGIDPVLRKSIWDELYRFAEQGVCIIVTTHVMDEADKCHRLAMMRDGRLIAQGSPEELQRQIGAASIEEAFIYYGSATNSQKNAQETNKEGGGQNES